MITLFVIIIIKVITGPARKSLFCACDIFNIFLFQYFVVLITSVFENPMGSQGLF